MANWFAHGVWLPIASLSSSYKEPVVFADETKTIQWFSKSADKSEVETSEHVRDEETNNFLYDDKDNPKLKKGKAKPAFWQPAVEVD